MFNPYLPNPTAMGDMVWINSKDELKNVTVLPNKQKVFFLRDADNPIFYVLCANEMGMVSTSAYKFEEMVEPNPYDKYVTRDEFQKLLDALGGNKNE